MATPTPATTRPPVKTRPRAEVLRQSPLFHAYLAWLRDEARALDRDRFVPSVRNLDEAIRDAEQRERDVEPW